MRKRFIAGAVCPKCKQLDKVYTYEKDGRDYASCTQCDYNEPRPLAEELDAIRAKGEAEEAEKAIPSQQVKWLH